MILAGRAVNDYMPKHIAEATIKKLNDKGKVIKGSKVTIMGLTYMQNVPDTRESPAKEIIHVLKEFKADIHGYDPLLSKENIEKFGVKAIDKLTDVRADAIILAVSHDKFKDDLRGDLTKGIMQSMVIVDVKGCLKRDEFFSL